MCVLFEKINRVDSFQIVTPKWYILILTIEEHENSSVCVRGYTPTPKIVFLFLKYGKIMKENISSPKKSEAEIVVNCHIMYRHVGT
jgi:hypothetical protein